MPKLVHKKKKPRKPLDEDVRDRFVQWANSSGIDEVFEDYSQDDYEFLPDIYEGTVFDWWSCWKAGFDAGQLS